MSAGSPGDKKPIMKDAGFSSFAALPMPVRVTAGRGTITLGKLRQLQPGDVLRLDRAGDGPLPLDCGGVVLAEVEVEAQGEGLTAAVVSLEDHHED